MPTEKDLDSQQSVTLASPDENLLNELGGYVVDDPNAPYVIDRNMTLLLRVRQVVSVGGHFPVGVAFLAIATIGSLIFIHSDYAQSRSHNENMWILGSFFTTALIAQVIDVVGKKK